MAINDIINEDWNMRSKQSVRVGLQNKLREFVTDITKANKKAVSGVSVDITGGVLDVIITLADGTQKRSSATISGLTPDISDELAQLTEDINEALKKRATLDGATGRVDYKELPHLVLASMGSLLDGGRVDLSGLGDVYVYEPRGKVLKYIGDDGGGVKIIGTPSAGMIYCNAVTGKLYRWDDEAADMVPVGGSDGAGAEELAGKADVLTYFGGGKMLDVSQWPRINVVSITHNDTEGIENGECYVKNDGDSVRITLYTNGHEEDMGLPVSYVLYYARKQKKLYRWNGQSFVEALLLPTKVSDLTNDLGFLTEHQQLKTINGEPITGSGDITVTGGGSTVTVDSDLDPSSSNPVANSAIATAINAINAAISDIDDGNLLDEASRLRYNNQPSVILDDLAFDPSTSISGPMEGKTVLTTDGKIWRFYIGVLNGRQALLYTEQDPDPGVVYWDRSTASTYRWDATEGRLTQFETVITWSAFVRKDSATGRIPYDNMPGMVLASMGKTLDNVDSTGTDQYAYLPTRDDYYYNPTQRKIIYVGSIDTSFDPDKAVVYCNAVTGRLYRWNGSKMVEVGNKGSGSSSGSSGQIMPSGGILGRGTFEQAFRESQDGGYQEALFAWLLNDVDDNGDDVTKVIYHIGNGRFIDAIGAEIDGKLDGLTIVTNGACDLMVGNTRIALPEGRTNLTASDLSSALTTTDEDNDTITSMRFYQTGTTTYDTTHVVSVDFGGFKLKTATITASNNRGTFQAMTNLVSVSRMVCVPNGNYKNTFLNTSAVSVEMGGDITNADFWHTFEGSTSLSRIDLSQMHGTPKVSFFTNLFTNTNVGLVDLSGIDTSLQNSLQAMFSNSSINTVIIGQGFDLSNVSSASTPFTNVSDTLTLVCTSSTVPNLGSGTVRNTWLQKFSTIKVPEGSLSAYQEAWGVGNATWIEY